MTSAALDLHLTQLSARVYQIIACLPARCVTARRVHDTVLIRIPGSRPAKWRRDVASAPRVMSCRSATLPSYGRPILGIVRRTPTYDESMEFLKTSGPKLDSDG